MAEAADNVCTFETPSGLKVVTYMGDVLECKAEGIVIAEGATFDILGLVAKALLAKDPHFKSSRNTLMKKKKKRFTAWQAYYSKSSGLFPCVLHAIIPIRCPERQGSDDWKHNLQILYANVLNEAEKQKITKLAFTLIGTGCIGAKPQVIIDLAMKAIRDFKKKEFLKEVIFPVLDELKGNAIGSVCLDLKFKFITAEDNMNINRKEKLQDAEGGHVKNKVNTDGMTGSEHLSKNEIENSTEGKFDQQKDNSDSDTAEGRQDKFEEKCPICLDNPKSIKKLDKCGHVFCKDCIDHWFQSNKPVCPTCKMVYGVVTGNQPPGTMDIAFSDYPLPGYESCGLITISYNFPSGSQKEDHPSPGTWYKCTNRTAYLPDNKEGREVLRLLKIAFDQKLIFTIGRSSTNGMDNRVTWNDIHHKTRTSGGSDRYGYPDKTYLMRVKQELADKGITKTMK